MLHILYLNSDIVQGDEGIIVIGEDEVADTEIETGTEIKVDRPSIQKVEKIFVLKYKTIDRH